MRRWRTLIVGVGSIGERHARCFQATGRVELGICEPNPELRQAVVDRYGVRESYGELAGALGSVSRWDVAVVATPAPLHVPMTARLIGAGVHTLVEKPLSISSDGVEELIQLARGSGLTTGVAYIHRSNPVLESMQQALRSGRFGRPLQVTAVCGQHFPTYRPAYRRTYYVSHASGGGAIQDALTHIVNAAEWLVGPVDRVMADAAHQKLEGVTVEDTAHVVARHGDVLACYSLNQHQAPNEFAITVVCERGTARIEFHHGHWLSMVEPGAEWHEEFQFAGQRDDVFIRQAGAFLDAVEEKRAFPCTLEEGFQTLRVNLAIMAAVKKQPWASV